MAMSGWPQWEGMIKAEQTALPHWMLEKHRSESEKIDGGPWLSAVHPTFVGIEVCSNADLPVSKPTKSQGSNAKWNTQTTLALARRISSRSDAPKNPPKAESSTDLPYAGWQWRTVAGFAQYLHTSF